AGTLRVVPPPRGMRGVRGTRLFSATRKEKMMIFALGRWNTRGRWASGSVNLVHQPRELILEARFDSVAGGIDGAGAQAQFLRHFLRRAALDDDLPERLPRRWLEFLAHDLERPPGEVLVEFGLPELCSGVLDLRLR